jgi:hypothetical protein
MVPLRTVQRDIQYVSAEFAKEIAVSRKRSAFMALAEDDEIARECWINYHKKPEEVLDAQGRPILDKHGNPRYRDDRGIKAVYLRMAHEVARDENRIAGFYSTRHLERAALLESPTGDAKTERLSIEQQVQDKVRELEEDESLRRKEGLLESDD